MVINIDGEEVRISAQDCIFARLTADSEEAAEEALRAGIRRGEIEKLSPLPRPAFLAPHRRG